MQNNELVEANEKLQKEMGLLRTVAKEALLEKKKSQSALESLKHQVVHLLGEHNILPKQGTLKQDPAVTGQHNAMFLSVFLGPQAGSTQIEQVGLIVALPACLEHKQSTGELPTSSLSKSQCMVTRSWWCLAIAQQDNLHG